MFILTTSYTNEIYLIHPDIKYSESHDMWVIDNVSFYDKRGFNLYEVDSIPSEVKAKEYCYTEEKGFYINPDYIEPDPSNTYGIPDSLYTQIIDDYTAELMEGGVI